MPRLRSELRPLVSRLAKAGSRGAGSSQCPPQGLFCYLVRTLKSSRALSTAHRFEQSNVYCGVHTAVLLVALRRGQRSPLLALAKPSLADLNLTGRLADRVGALCFHTRIAARGVFSVDR